MAFYYERIGEIEAARQAYQRAIALNPVGGIEHNNYGVFLCKQQEYRYSEKEFLQAISDPNYLNAAEALENAGLCVLAIPDEDKAMKYFKRALAHDLKRPHALIELAYLYYQKKDRETALHYYERYQKIAEPTERSKWLGRQLEKK
jgi:type IV pilus assembly protein PilF